MLITLSKEECIKRHTESFAKFSPGDFFTVQIGCTDHNRLFMVKERLDDQHLKVVEISSNANRKAILENRQLNDFVYEFNVDDNLNIFNIGDPEDHKKELEDLRCFKLLSEFYDSYKEEIRKLVLSGYEGPKRLDGKGMLAWVRLYLKDNEEIIYTFSIDHPDNRHETGIKYTIIRKLKLFPDAEEILNEFFEAHIEEIRARAVEELQYQSSEDSGKRKCAWIILSLNKNDEISYTCTLNRKDLNKARNSINDISIRRLELFPSNNNNFEWC